MISEIISTLIPILSSVFVTTVTLFWLFIKYPEKIEKWISMLTRAVAYVSEKAAKTHMATDVQSTIDACRKKLNTHEEIFSYGVSVKWTNVDRVQIDLKESKVVIMMRPYQSQARNLAHIVSVYVPRALLPKARRYIEPNLILGIDHTISKSILEKNTSALEYYLSEVMDKISDEVRSYIAKMDKIHEQGTLTRVVLSELKRLDILYPQEPNYSTYEDSTKLAQLMYEFVTREPGVDVSPNYIGAYIRMAIVTVARPEKILLGKTTPHFEFIKAMLSKGVDHFYIVSAGPLIGYAKDLINDTQQKLQLRKVYEEEYEGKFRGKMTKMFCALLVSAS